MDVPSHAADEVPLLLDADAARLLEAARRGRSVERRLTVAGLEPGNVGVLEAAVQEVGATRTFRRRNGGEGLLCRVRLADATGEVGLVLWDDEVRLVGQGPLQPGQAVRLRGPTVRPGYRGGVELHLGSAVLEAMEAPAGEASGRLEGLLADVGPTRPVGDPPAVRFTADATVQTAAGPARVVLWDDLVRAAHRLDPGARIRLDGLRAHPALDGWWIAEDGARLERLADST